MLLRQLTYAVHNRKITEVYLLGNGRFCFVPFAKKDFFKQKCFSVKFTECNIHIYFKIIGVPKLAVSHILFDNALSVERILLILHIIVFILYIIF